MSPAVSIGMPVRNEAKFLREAIESLLVQDFSDFEILISDNASTDETPEICREYEKKDARIRYTRNEKNIGMTANQNRVFAMSRGEFFMWAAGHDLWDRAFLQKSVDLMRRDPTVALCYPVICSTSRYGTPNPQPDQMPCRIDTRGLGASSRINLILWGMGSCGIIYGLLRSEALRKTRLFRRVVCPDNLILFELSLTGAIASLPEPLLFLRGNAADRVTVSQAMDRYRDMFYPEDRRWFRLWMTNWRLFYEHLAAVIRSDQPINRKPVLLTLTFFGFLARRGKHMIHDVIEAVGLPRP